MLIMLYKQNNHESLPCSFSVIVAEKEQGSDLY